MTYQDQTTTLAEQTSAQVLAALAAYAAGTLTYEAVAAVVAAYIAAGNSAGAALGDVALAAAVSLQTGAPAAPLGVTRPADDDERLTKAAKTILDDLDREGTHSASALDRAQMRARRLAEAEIRKAVADAYSEAIKDNTSVTGWIRVLEPSPTCQLCRNWWRDGRVWPADHPMPRHTGCDCSQQIVTTTEPPKPVRQH